MERDSAVRLGDSKLLERIRTLETEVADSDEYADDLEQQLEQLSTEKDSLVACVSILEVTRCANFHIFLVHSFICDGVGPVCLPLLSVEVLPSGPPITGARYCNPVCPYAI